MNQLVALQICSVCSNWNGILLLMRVGAVQSVQMSKLNFCSFEGSSYIWYHYSANVHDRKMLFGTLVDSILKMSYTNFECSTTYITEVVSVTKLSLLWASELSNCMSNQNAV